MIAKYKALKRPMRVFAEGKVIGGGINLKPAPYLPIVEVTPDTQPVVIKKGTFVTLDQNGFVIPAYPSQKQLTYSAVDVQFGVINIDTGEPVQAAGTSTQTISGKPIGIALYDYFLNLPQFQADYNIQPEVGILTEGLILLALDSAHSSVQYKPGDVLELDSAGFPVPVAQLNVTVDESGSATHEIKLDASNFVGKLVRVIDATDQSLGWTGGYELVAPASGLDLPGIENGGILDGIDETTKKGLLIKLGF